MPNKLSLNNVSRIIVDHTIHQRCNQNASKANWAIENLTVTFGQSVMWETERRVILEPIVARKITGYLRVIEGTAYILKDAGRVDT